MNDILNPYIAGAPVVETSMFFGREDIFGWIERSLAGKYVDHILVLHGQRRVGKTSVLKQIPNFLPEKYIQVFYDLQGRTGTTLDRFLWWLASEIVRTLKKERGIILPKPDRKAFKDTEYLINEFLPSLQPILGEHILLLTFDEFDTLDRAEIQEEFAKPLIAYLRRLIEIDGLSFIFSIGSSGDKLENMQASYTDFFKSALYRKISFLTRDDCYRLITKPVEGVIKYDKKAVDQIVKISSGHPYFAQLTCHELFSLCQKTGSREISAKDVEAILEDVIERGTVNLKFVWDEASNLEKWILAALAQMDGGNKKKLANILNEQRVRFSDSDLNSAVIHLQDKDVITKANHFVIRLMRMWLIANRPIDRVREELVEVNPIANRYIEIGDEYRDRGQNQMAIESYQQALSADPGNLKAQSNIATVYLEQEDYSKAVTAFELALKIDDEDVVARTGYCDANLALGDAAQSRGETDLALGLFQAILVLNPSHTDARHRLSAIYRQQAESQLATGRDDEALNAFNQAIMLTPEDDSLSARYAEVLAEKKSKVINTWLGKAEKALSRQRWDNAAEMVGEAVKIDPENQELQEKLVEVKDAPRQFKLQGYRREAKEATARGNWDKAIAVIETALQLAPEDRSLADWLETVRNDQLNEQLSLYAQQADKAVAVENWDAAIQAIQKAIKLAPKEEKWQIRLDEIERTRHQAQLDVFLAQANEARKNSRWDEAISALEELLKLEDSEEVRIDIESIRKEKLDSELAILESQAEKDVAAENWDAAIQAIQKAIKLAPKEKKWQIRLDEIERARHQAQLDVFLAQANEARKNSRWDEAISALEELLKLEDSEEVRIDIESIRKEKLDSELAILGSQAEKAVVAENWDVAIQAIQKAIKLAPKKEKWQIRLDEIERARHQARLNIFLAQANEARKKNRWDEAISALKELLKLEDSEKVRAEIESIRKEKRESELAAFRTQAEKATKAENWDEAAQAWDAYLALKPGDGDSIESKLQYARKYAKIAGDYGEAQQAIRKKRYGHAIELLQGIIAQDPAYKSTSRLLVEAVEANKAVPIWRRSWRYWALGVAGVVVLGVFFGSGLFSQPTSIINEKLIEPTSTLVPVLTSTPPPTPEASINFSEAATIVLAYIAVQAPTFQDTFSTSKSEWGFPSEGYIFDDPQMGHTLKISDAIQESNDLLLNSGLLGFSFPTNGLFDATNFWLEFDCNLIPDDQQLDEMGVVFRATQDRSTYYSFEFVNKGSSWGWNLVQLKENGNLLSLASGDINIPSDSSFLMVVFDNNLLFFMNDALIYSTESIALSGDSNLFFGAGSDTTYALLDNVRFWDLAGVDIGGTTAIPEPTLDPTIQSVLNAIQSEAPTYQTSFDSWDFGESSGNAKVEDGKLIITSESQDSAGVYLNNLSSDNFVVKFEFRILESNPESSCIFLTRNDAENGSESWRAISAQFHDNRALLGRFEYPDIEDFVFVDDYGASSVNTVTLFILGDQITAFVNGQIIYTALDPDGSTVYTHHNLNAYGEIVCEYDNYKIWSLNWAEPDQ